MPNLKHSRQREAIQTFLAHSQEHPTADMVYKNIRKTFPNISLGTVYRNLSLLSKLGDIQKISMKEGPDRFDGQTLPHDHFICDKCHCIQDLYPDNNQDIAAHAQQKFDGIIHSHSTFFYGICGKCLQKESENMQKRVSE